MPVRVTAHRAEVSYVAEVATTEVRVTAHRVEVSYVPVQPPMDLETEVGARTRQTIVQDGRTDLLLPLIYRR